MNNLMPFECFSCITISFFYMLRIQMLHIFRSPHCNEREKKQDNWNSWNELNFEPFSTARHIFFAIRITRLRQSNVDAILYFSFHPCSNTPNTQESANIPLMADQFDSIHYIVFRVAHLCSAANVFGNSATKFATTIQERVL